MPQDDGGGSSGEKPACLHRQAVVLRKEGFFPEQHQNWVLEVPGVGAPKQKGVGSGWRGMWGLVSWIPARRIHGAKSARPGRSQPPKVFKVS